MGFFHELCAIIMVKLKNMNATPWLKRRGKDFRNWKEEKKWSQFLISLKFQSVCVSLFATLRVHVSITFSYSLSSCLAAKIRFQIFIPIFFRFFFSHSNKVLLFSFIVVTFSIIFLFALNNILLLSYKLKIVSKVISSRSFIDICF